MSANQAGAGALQVPAESDLESAFIDVFLRARGYDASHTLPADTRERERLFKDACFYASLKLAEIHELSRFIHDLHGEEHV
jgi:hypothetical protein